MTEKKTGNDQVSVSLDVRFIEKATEIAKKQNRSLSSLLGQAIYSVFGYGGDRDEWAGTGSKKDMDTQKNDSA